MVRLDIFSAHSYSFHIHVLIHCSILLCVYVFSCWPSDRQANDNNGNCATPYDENCVDADPGDNTDLCAVDMARSSSNSVKVPDGLAFYEGNGEGPIHCHG